MIHSKESEKIIERITETRTDGMFSLRIEEVDKYYLDVSFIEDVHDVLEPTQTIKIHISDFWDFVDAIKNAEARVLRKRCHFRDMLCQFNFQCKDCEYNAT